MVNIIFAADFPIEKTGILSTGSSIIESGVLSPSKIFSEQSLIINGVLSCPISGLGDEVVHLIFTHLEYSNLSSLLDAYPSALIHVGDWPLQYWNSVIKLQAIKGMLAKIRFFWRIRRLNRNCRLVFVAEEDCVSAISFGFSKSVFIPIGVRSPKVPLANTLESNSICFSGNFRYPPNREAAKRLIELARKKLPQYRIILVGFFAEDLKNIAGESIEIHADVASIVDFLALRRPLYVSLINVGAGAKNKILEAIVSGCPVICTLESLDSSIVISSSIKVVARDEDVLTQLQEWARPDQLGELQLDSLSSAYWARNDRSWSSVAKKVNHLIFPSQ